MCISCIGSWEGNLTFQYSKAIWSFEDLQVIPDQKLVIPNQTCNMFVFSRESIRIQGLPSRATCHGEPHSELVPARVPRPFTNINQGADLHKHSVGWSTSWRNTNEFEINMCGFPFIGLIRIGIVMRFEKTTCLTV